MKDDGLWNTSNRSANNQQKSDATVKNSNDNKAKGAPKDTSSEPK